MGLLHSIFYSSCTSLHSHEECTRVLISQHSHQCLFFYLFIYYYYYYYYYLYHCKKLVPNPSSAAHHWKDKSWWKRKSFFIQEISNLERWPTNVLRPSPSCQWGHKSFKGSVREGISLGVNSLGTILWLFGIMM